MNLCQTNPTEAASAIFAYLRKLRTDRGAMADLRCALVPTKLPRAWPLLAKIDGIGNQRIQTVAALFAYHPDETDNGNLGTTCHRLMRQNPSFDARFRRLLACDREEICGRLRPVIMAAKAKGIPVNYEQLFTDLCYWSGSVKERWAREYWGSGESDELPAETSSEVTS